MINEYSQPLQVLFTLPEDPFDYEDYDFWRSVLLLSIFQN
jgi:hypothetical protein